MKKVAVAIGLIGLTLGLLLLLAALTIPKWIDVARYKPLLEKRIAEVTGRSFSVDGQMQLDLIPHTRLKVSDMAFGNRAGFEGPPLLTVRRIEIRLKPLPLISGKLVVEWVRVDGLQICLYRDAAGRGNWEELFGTGQIADAVDALWRPDGAPVEGLRLAPGFVQLGIDEAIVSDASVRWLDLEGQTDWQLSGIDLIAAGLSLDRSITVDLAFRINKQPLTVAARIGPLADFKLPGHSPVPVEADLSLSDIARIEVRGAIGDRGSEGAVVLQATLAPLSLRKIAESLGHRAHTADPGVLERFGFDLNLAAEPSKSTRIAGHIELDESRITIAGTARPADRAHIRLALKVDRIDIDRYLPPARDPGGAGQQTRSPAAEVPGGQSALASGFRHSNGADIAGTLQVGALTVKGLQWENLRAEVSAGDGRLELPTISGDLYGGIVAGGAGIDWTGDEARGQVTLQIQDVPAGPLLRALTDEDVLEGNITGRASFSVHGSRWEGLVASLAGSGEIVLTQGRLEGIDLSAIVGVERKASDAVSEPGRLRQTAFDELRLPFRLDRGRLQTPGSTLTAPGMIFNAVGQADTATGTVDLRITPQMGRALPAGEGHPPGDVQVVLRVTGPIREPIIRQDPGEAVWEQGRLN